MRARRVHKSLIHVGFGAVLIIVIALGITVTVAQQIPFSDGRINQISFFGGDAFYCVDKEYRVTMELPDVANGGGFRLLNMTGQHLWYIPGADVTKALDQLTGSSGPILVASGQGSYGTTTLYVNKDADNQNMYIYVGYDNYSKLNSFIFGSCIPQGAPSDFSLTPSAVPTAGPSPTASNTAIVAASATPVITNTTGPSLTPSLTLTPSETLTPTNTFTATDTLTSTNTSTATDTLTPTNTFTATSTATDTLTPTNTFTPTDTLTPTNTFTPTDTLTPTNTFTPTDTLTPTNTFTPDNP